MELMCPVVPEMSYHRRTGPFTAGSEHDFVRSCTQRIKHMLLMSFEIVVGVRFALGTSAGVDLPGGSGCMRQ
jgi:hypothetical protein